MNGKFSQRIEEYVTYLKMVTPKIGDATKELREITKDLSLDEVIKGAKELEKRDRKSDD